MKFRIAYNSYYTEGKNKGNRRRYHFITETIDARGVMHAAKLATDHAKELEKTLGETVRVADIAQVIPK